MISWNAWCINTIIQPIISDRINSGTRFYERDSIDLDYPNIIHLFHDHIGEKSSLLRRTTISFSQAEIYVTGGGQNIL